jgi:hypothetical protein
MGMGGRAGLSPADFLTDLAKQLREQDSVDFDLADVLATHLLTTDPAKDPSADAYNSILALAAKRAASPTVGAND